MQLEETQSSTERVPTTGQSPGFRSGSAPRLLFRLLLKPATCHRQLPGSRMYLGKSNGRVPPPTKHLAITPLIPPISHCETEKLHTSNVVTYHSSQCHFFSGHTTGRAGFSAACAQCVFRPDVGVNNSPVEQPPAPRALNMFQQHAVDRV